jgi:hypothetical protein
MSDIYEQNRRPAEFTCPIPHSLPCACEAHSPRCFRWPVALERGICPRDLGNIEMFARLAAARSRLPVTTAVRSFTYGDFSKATLSA